MNDHVLHPPLHPAQAKVRPIALAVNQAANDLRRQEEIIRRNLRRHPLDRSR